MTTVLPWCAGTKMQIDATMERRICAAVLKQLDDNSNDVQTIAVKCLGALLRKVQEAQVCFCFVVV